MCIRDSDYPTMRNMPEDMRREAVYSPERQGGAVEAVLSLFDHNPARRPVLVSILGWCDGGCLNSELTEKVDALQADNRSVYGLSLIHISIELRVHRRIRLQLAHDFRNLIPCNDREPSAHDEPLLERIAPDHRLYPELFLELLREPERHGLALVDLHRNALVLKHAQMLPSSLRPHL